MLNLSLNLSYDRLTDFCQRWQVTELALFGSVLGKQFRPDSDVDVLVSFSEEARWTLFDMVAMEDELTALFGRDVDLVERRAVERSENYIRRKHVLGSAETLYVAG